MHLSDIKIFYVKISFKLKSIGQIIYDNAITVGIFLKDNVHKTAAFFKTCIFLKKHEEDYDLLKKNNKSYENIKLTTIEKDDPVEDTGYLGDKDTSYDSDYSNAQAKNILKKQLNEVIVQHHSNNSNTTNKTPPNSPNASNSNSLDIIPVSSYIKNKTDSSIDSKNPTSNNSSLDTIPASSSDENETDSSSYPSTGKEDSSSDSSNYSSKTNSLDTIPGSSSDEDEIDSFSDSSNHSSNNSSLDSIPGSLSAEKKINSSNNPSKPLLNNSSLEAAPDSSSDEDETNVELTGETDFVVVNIS